MNTHESSASISMTITEDDKARLVAPPTVDHPRAPLVWIFRVYEVPTGVLLYTGYSLDPTYKFLDRMFKPHEEYTVCLSIRNIMTEVEIEIPEQATIGLSNINPSDGSVIVTGFQQPESSLFHQIRK